MELEKNRIIMEKSWNFVKYYDKTTSCQKTSCRTHSVRQLAFWLLVVFKFEQFQNAYMVYKHAVVVAFCIYAQYGEVAAKMRGWSLLH